MLQIFTQDFDMFNPLSKVSSSTLVHIIRNQENYATSHN